MNAEKYLKPSAIVPVTMDAIRDLVELGKQQADRIAELEKRKWSEQDIKNACIGARLSEGDFLRIKAYLPIYSAPQTNNKNRSWSDICDEATAVWDSLDTSNQSNIECARAWFLEGYHQALTRGQE